MTQAQLATKARVSQPTISKYENEPGTEYRAHILYKIAGALGTTPEWLLRGTGPKYIKDLTGNIEELKHVAASLDRDQLAILISLAKSMKK